ncbi:hypothetical protein [Streptomyces sp. NPDC058268]|uniref:hypothetical protein n=1 Tax=Streptomyces sp. NPDC058268 TaxID=3346413 RepID=UPI0036E239B0
MEFTDWIDCGLPTVRALLAEAVTAEFAHAQDVHAVWHGGQQRGYDVVSTAGRSDAKSVRLDADGYLVLARRNAVPFDAARVDRLMLLHMEGHTGYRVDLAGRSAELAARAQILGGWDVPVEVLNKVMPEHGPDDPAWRNVLLDPADLADYKVL